MKTLLICLMLLAGIKSNGQDTKTLQYVDTSLYISLKDTRTFGSIYWRSTQMYDTVPVIFQYSDTIILGNAIRLAKGYAVKKYEPYTYGTILYIENYYRYSGGWTTTGYILLDKKPIPTTWVVWMVLEIKKPDQ